MQQQSLGKIDKGWGYEILWANNERYSGKILIFPSAGSKTSLVFHKEKIKSWFVNSGKFKISFIDINSGEFKEITIGEGKTVDFDHLTPHRLESLEDNSMIFEVSTTDYVEDRFRLSPGDTQLLKQQPNHSS